MCGPAVGTEPPTSRGKGGPKLHPKKCAQCGGAVQTSYGAIPFEVRGEIVQVAGIDHGECSSCGEVYLAIDGAERLQAEAIRASKAARQLLSPEEIKDLRHSLSLSQVAFEKLLGVGAKTVVRWEKGTVFQSATADRLMRLLRAMPELTTVLSSGELYPRHSHPNMPTECINRTT